MCPPWPSEVIRSFSIESEVAITAREARFGYFSAMYASMARAKSAYSFCSGSEISDARGRNPSAMGVSGPLPAGARRSIKRAFSSAAFRTARTASSEHSAMEENPYTPFLYTRADTPEISDLALAVRLPLSSVTRLERLSCARNSAWASLGSRCLWGVMIS